MMKIFIAGIMQGSKKGKGIQAQDYRQRIRAAVEINHPEAKIVEPFSLFPDSVTYDDQRAKQTLFAMAEEAGSSDILIAYLPNASMGTALEMVRAYDNGTIIISISSLDANWFIRSLSEKIFPSLDEFCDWAGQMQFSELIDAATA
jgi:hypothetical protein